MFTFKLELETGDAAERREVRDRSSRLESRTIVLCWAEVGVSRR
jgi:hypothetical protein